MDDQTNKPAATPNLHSMEGGLFVRVYGRRNRVGSPGGPVHSSPVKNESGIMEPQILPMHRDQDRWTQMERQGVRTVFGWIATSLRVLRGFAR